MTTQSWKNLDPETGVHGEVDEKDWPLIREIGLHTTKK